MKTYISDGGVVQYVAPAAHTGGVGYVVDSMFLVAQATFASGADASGVVNGVVNLPKSAAVFSLGEKVFWDDTAKQCKESASGYFLIGVATKAAATGDATVDVLLAGAPVTAV